MEKLLGGTVDACLGGTQGQWHAENAERGARRIFMKSNDQARKQNTVKSAKQTFQCKWIKQQSRRERCWHKRRHKFRAATSQNAARRKNSTPCQSMVQYTNFFVALKQTPVISHVIINPSAYPSQQNSILPSHVHLRQQLLQDGNLIQDRGFGGSTSS